MDDEEVIKRRLLIDGDGTGDDRRLNSLFKEFCKWIHTTNETPSEVKATREKLLSQLSQCKHMHTKTQLMTHTSKIELDNSSLRSKNIEEQIEDAKLMLENSKKELQNAKMMRKHSVEYDAIVNSIQKYPTRKESNSKLARLNKELNVLQELKRRVDENFETFQGHYQVFSTSLNHLQATAMKFEENQNSAVDVHTVDILDEELMMDSVKPELSETTKTDL